jgi:hypothetical protein
MNDKSKEENYPWLIYAPYSKSFSRSMDYIYGQFILMYN